MPFLRSIIPLCLFLKKEKFKIYDSGCTGLFLFILASKDNTTQLPLYYAHLFNIYQLLFTNRKQIFWYYFIMPVRWVYTS